VNRGLTVRTSIILSLEESQKTARNLSKILGIKYSSVLHHLRLMEEEHIVTRYNKKPYTWMLTGAGQKRLTNT